MDETGVHTPLLFITDQAPHPPVTVLRVELGVDVVEFEGGNEAPAFKLALNIATSAIVERDSMIRVK